MMPGAIIHALAYAEDGLDHAPRVALVFVVVFAMVFAMVFLGLLGPAFIDNWRRGIGPAFGFACVGFVVGAAWPWDLDNSYIVDRGYVWLAAGLLGGSLGWLIGAAVGWFHPRFAVERSERKARRLWVAVALIPLLLTIPLLVGASPAYPGPSWVHMFAASEAIAAVTLLVFAQRNRFRQAGAVVGAIAAITIIGIAGIGFSSAMPSNRAWLDVWRSDQPEAASFAQNLLIPASRVCPVAGLDPAIRYPSSDSSTWLDGHVPRWLPDDFGILSWDRNPSVGTWTNAGCGLVRLTLEDHKWVPRRDLLDRAKVDRIGSWFVWELDCRPGSTAEDGPCLVYRAGSGEGAVGEVVSPHLLMRGIDRDVGDRIALGIPV